MSQKTVYPLLAMSLTAIIRHLHARTIREKRRGLRAMERVVALGVLVLG